MKKSALFALFLVFSLFSANAQEKNIEIGVSLFPNYSIPRRTANDLIDPIFEPGFQGINAWKPALSATVFVEYHLAEHASIGVGLGYQNLGERSQKFDLIFAIDPVTGQPIIDPSFPTQARFIANYHHAEIPVYYKHTFGKRFYALAGVSAMINITNSTTSVSYYADGKKNRSTSTDNLTDYSPINIAGNIGFGIDLFSTEKLTGFIQPYGQYTFLGIAKNTPVNRNYIAVGLSLGVRY